MEKKRNLFKKAGLGALLVMTLLAPVSSNAATPKANPFKQYPTKVEVMEDSKVDYVITLHSKDGTQVRLDKKFNYGVKVVNQRTSVAMKDITDNIKGLDLNWDQPNQIAEAKGLGKDLKYPLNKRVMSTGDKIVELDTSATVDTKVSRTYLPLRSLMESLDYEVDYNHDAKSIDIIEKGAKKPEVKPVDKPIDKPVSNAPKAKTRNLAEALEARKNGEWYEGVIVYEGVDVSTLKEIPRVGEYLISGHNIMNPEMIEYYRAPNYVLYDATEFYRDLEFDGYFNEEAMDGLKYLTLTGTDIKVNGMNAGKSWVNMAFVDSDNNIYPTTLGLAAFGNFDNKTIKTIYMQKQSAVIKIDLKNPIKIEPLIKDKTTLRKNGSGYTKAVRFKY